LNGVELNSLFFADDIVIMASSKEDLNKLLDIVSEYARKWRFEVNISKSKYMVFGKESKRTKIKLNGEELERVECYKYLGFDIDSKLNWKSHCTRLLNSARKRFYLMYSFQSFRRISLRSAIYAWNMLVKPKFEYGFELWYTKRIHSFECFQREVGKKLLRISSKTTNEAVLGELGWYEVIDRADIARLKLYYTIMKKDSANLCRQVMVNQQLNCKKYTWTYRVIDLMKQLNLYDQDINMLSRKAWDMLVRGAIHTRALDNWKKGVLSKPKLRTYRLFKKHLSYENYLDDSDLRKFTMVKLRSGTSNLEIEKGRWKKQKVEERLCQFCPQVEDEAHFLLECKEYTDIRNKFKDKVMPKYNCGELNLDTLLNQPNPNFRQDIYEYIDSCYRLRDASSGQLRTTRF